jgi:hypothetical protein
LNITPAQDEIKVGANKALKLKFKGKIEVSDIYKEVLKRTIMARCGGAHL